MTRLDPIPGKNFAEINAFPQKTSALGKVDIF